MDVWGEDSLDKIPVVGIPVENVIGGIVSLGGGIVSAITQGGVSETETIIDRNATGHENPCIKVITVNGIFNDKEGRVDSGGAMLEMLNEARRTRHLERIKSAKHVHNESGLFGLSNVVKLTESLIPGTRTKETELIKDEIRKALKAKVGICCPNGIIIYLMGHSNGTAHIIDALRDLSPEERKHVVEVGIGGQRTLDSNNIAGKYDPVAYYDPTGEARHWVDTGIFGHAVVDYQETSGKKASEPFWDKVLSKETAGR